MTGIQWTDETWNPVTGCTKVSAGCKNCYAERLAPRVFAGQVVDRVLSDRVDGGGVVEKGPRRFTDVRTHPDRLAQPLRWRKPRRVFVNSMSDLFHEDVPDEFIDRVFAVMALAPQHWFQVLTKRPERMLRWFGPVGGVTRRDFVRSQEGRRLNVSRLPPREWPLPNVWIGVSCEDQGAADARIPLLLDTPAAVRFVSAEPLLGPIEFEMVASVPVPGGRMGWDVLDRESKHLDWIIVGGESGPKARPCDVAWIRSIVQQCRSAGVACFVKQLGADWVADGMFDRGLRDAMTDRKGGDPSEWPDDLRVREFPGGSS